MSLRVEISLPGAARAPAPQDVARSLLGAGNRLIVMGRADLVAATLSVCHDADGSLAVIDPRTSGEDRIAGLQRARDILHGSYPGAVFLPLAGPLPASERDRFVSRLFGQEIGFPHTDALLLYLEDAAA